MTALPEFTEHYTVEEFRHLCESGAFDDRRVELLDGEIVEMAPPGPFHQAVTQRLVLLFRSLLGEHAALSLQSPLPSGQRSQPEPDFCLIDLLADQEFRPPRPQDVYLLVEISDSSLQTDLKRKAAIYASASIPEYWVVNIPHLCLEVFRDPVPAERRYASVHQFELQDTVAPLAFPDHPVSVAAILGRG